MQVRHFIYRLLNLVALLAAAAWWASQGGWEPAVVTIGLLATVIYGTAGGEQGAAGTTGAGVAGSLAPAPTPTWEQWLPKKKPLIASIGAGLKALVIAVIVAVVALAAMAVSPAEWRFIHGSAYIPVRGFVLSFVLAGLCMYGESRENSGGLLMLLLVFVVAVFAGGLSSEESYLMDTLFSPTPWRHPDLPYQTELPWGWGEIRFWHIWSATVFLSVFLGVARNNQPWGWFVWVGATLFLWNQLYG